MASAHARIGMIVLGFCGSALYIDVLTHMAYPRAKAAIIDGRPADEAIAKGEAAVREALGLIPVLRRSGSGLRNDPAVRPRGRKSVALLATHSV